MSGATEKEADDVRDGKTGGLGRRERAASEEPKRNIPLHKLLRLPRMSVGGKKPRTKPKPDFSDRVETPEKEVPKEPTDFTKFKKTDNLIGTPVLAKMKGYPEWPGLVTHPPEELKKPASKSNVHCIYFFGTENFSWIEADKIHPYQENKFLVSSKKSAGLMKAIEKLEQFIDKGTRNAALKKLLVVKEANEPSKTVSRGKITPNIRSKRGTGSLGSDEDLSTSRKRLALDNDGKTNELNSKTPEKSVDRKRKSTLSKEKLFTPAEKKRKSPAQTEKNKTPEKITKSPATSVKKTRNVTEKSTKSPPQKEEKSERSRRSSIVREKDKKTPVTEKPKKSPVTSERRKKPSIPTEAKEKKTPVTTEKRKAASEATEEVKELDNEDQTPVKVKKASVPKKKDDKLQTPKAKKTKMLTETEEGPSTIRREKKRGSFRIVSLGNSYECLKTSLPGLRPGTPPLNVEDVSDHLKVKNIEPSKLSFGFLGLGKMGSGLLKNLLQSGHKVTIWNRSPEKCTPFEQIGGEIALTPSDVVLAADITFCIADPEATKELVFGNCGVLSEMRAGKSFVEMSGIDIQTSHDISKAVNDSGGRYLEVRFFGGIPEAAEGDLVVFASGDRSLYDECSSCFQAFGKLSSFIPGEHSAAKLFFLFQTMEATWLGCLSEHLIVSDYLNIPREVLIIILEKLNVACPLIVNAIKAMKNSSASLRQPLGYLQKDMNNLLELSENNNVPMFLASLWNENFKHAKSLGLKDHDVTALIHAL